jgi:branched-chain amino acid transport system substrate-binding protein
LAVEDHGDGVRAFLIADVRGYTSFTQERGDVEAARLASRFAALVRDCVDAAGGRVVELRGDEALCVFDSPRQALRTAVALQGRFADATREDPSLPMRVGIGLEAGEAVAVEGGFRGAALNLAARLCALAGPWEVLAGDGIVLMAGRVDELAYSDRGRVSVKGVRDPVRVNQLQFELDLPPAPAPVAQPPLFKRRRRLLVMLAGVAVAAAGVGAFLIARGGDGGPPEALGDSAALLEPTSGRLLAQFPVGATPIAVVSDDSAAWTLDADGETISRIDPNGRRPLTKAAPGTPAGLALGGGFLWVAFVERDRGGTKAGIASLDPSTLSARSRTVLPGVAPDYGDVPAVAYAGDAVWVSGPSDLLRRIDPTSGHVTATIRLGSEALGLAGDRGSLWATAGRDMVVQIDPAKARITKRLHLSTPGVGAVAIGAGSVWVADPLAGVLWRIRPGPPEETHTVRVGLGASGLAYGHGVIWVASAVDGQVARVDASTEKVTTFPVGNAPLAVSVSPSGIWTAVAAAGGRSIAATPKLLGLDTLPAGTCSSAVYGGSGRPDALIVSDLPTQSVEAPVTLAMVQAVEFVLRRHHFRAGSYGIAYQACDDATVAAGSFTAEKCAANAKTYAAAAAVIGVIGPENSGCATSQIAIANGAKSGPLAFVSPTASYVGLTRGGPGVGPGEPMKYYPTGIRNFARVYPPDDAQGAAGAILANRRGVKRAYVFESDPNEQYGVALGSSFAKAARALGIHVDGPQSPTPKRDGYRSLAQRLRSSGIDGIYLAGLNDERAAEFIRAARAAIGPRLVVIAPDAFVPASNQVHAIGKAAIGMYVTGGVVSDPLNQLPPAGRRFAREFSATQSRRNVNFYAPYAAQAAEVLLQAIAHSDGTRASVTRQLLSVRIRDGIFGSVAFDRSGDLKSNLFPIFRVERAAPDVLYPEDHVVSVIAAPLRLIR